MTDAATIDGGAPEPPPMPEPFKPAKPPRFWRARRWLGSLNPITLLFGPVFQRDVRIGGRKKGTYVARLLVLAIPTAFVALVFASRSSYSWGSSGSAAARIQALQDSALIVANTVAWCQLIMLALIAPLLTAGTVVEERTARALSVIAASPLSPGRVIGGLFSARMVQLGILALLPLPLVLAIRTFGGLETSFIAWSMAIAICNAVAIAAVGLWASTRSSRPAGATSFAILFLMLYWAAGPLIILCESLVSGRMGGMPRSLWVLVSCPPAVLGMLSSPFPFGVFSFTTETVAAINCGISLTIAACALTLARWKLAGLIATDRVELVRQPSRRERKRARRALSAGSTGDAGSLTAAHDSSRAISGNPVLWRELRQRLFGSGIVRWSGVVGIVVVVGLIHYASRDIDRYDTWSVIVLPSTAGLILMLFSAAATPAGAVTSELEARTWAVLLTTPLTPFQILLPKVVGSLRKLWPAFAFVTLNLLACCARGMVPFWAIVFTLLHFVAYAVFLCCTGVFLSLKSRKSAAASTLNISLLLGLWLVLPIILTATLAILRAGRANDDLLGVFFFSNPVFTFVVGLVGMSEGNPGRYDMGPLNLSGTSYFTFWTISLLCYLGAAYLVLNYARRQFQRLSTARV